MPAADATAIERVFREEYGRAVAVMVRVFGDIDIAEESVQEAFTVAVQRWPTTGMPPSPAGWIITTARNRAIDRLRREASRDDRHAQAYLLHVQGEPPREMAVSDDRLRLIFTCCHPALAPGAQVALTLRLLGGLSTTEIARAFLVPEPTMCSLPSANGPSVVSTSPSWTRTTVAMLGGCSPPANTHTPAALSVVLKAATSVYICCIFSVGGSGLSATECTLSKYCFIGFSSQLDRNIPVPVSPWAVAASSWRPMPV